MSDEIRKQNAIILSMLYAQRHRAFSMMEEAVKEQQADKTSTRENNVIL